MGFSDIAKYDDNDGFPIVITVGSFDSLANDF